MIYLGRPKNFNPSFNVAGCFCEHDGRILLLQRQSHKRRGGMWGAPAGKINLGEAPAEAMVRELMEETGMRASPAKLKFFRKVYVRYTDCDFVYHMFSANASNENVSIRYAEHKTYKWVRPIEALSMELVPDMDGCIRMFYGIRPRIERPLSSYSFPTRLMR